MNKLKISVIGAGYVGLITGLVFSEAGYQTICVDPISEKVNKINNGVSPFFESGIDLILQKKLETLGK